MEISIPLLCRVVLINSVLVGVFGFWASTFILPSEVIKQIEAVCRNFLWSGAETYSLRPLVKWQGVCQPKTAGGIGLKNMKIWNNALIAKHIWAIANKKALTRGTLDTCTLLTAPRVGISALVNTTPYCHGLRLCGTGLLFLDMLCYYLWIIMHKKLFSNEYSYSFGTCALIAPYVGLQRSHKSTSCLTARSVL